MAQKKSQDVYIFPALHTQSKIRDRNFVSGKKLFQVQDGGTVTGPGLLYYTKGMPIAVLSTMCTSIGLVNETRYQAVGIVSDENSISNFRKVHNLANGYSNLLSNGFKYCFVQPSFQSCTTTSIYFFKTCVFQAQSICYPDFSN